MNRRIFLKGLAATGMLAAAGGLGGMTFLGTEAFGALPEGEALARVLASPHQANGVFRNLEPAPILADKQSFVTSRVRWIFRKTERARPEQPLPFVKADLKTGRDGIVWLGHSSLFVRVRGRTLLVDPVFSPCGSPVPFANRAFEGTTVYRASDMPPIDALVITHDHWDHLDHASVLALKDRTARVICGLGTGAHFARWGFEKGRILEGDWGDTLELFPDMALHLTTARHFAGRSLRNHDRALWCGFVLETPHLKLFHNGDGGYGKHFADIGNRFGPVDLAVLDSGQYNERWPTVHMFPHEAARAAEDVGARHFLPAHSGRFCLSQHPWDEPFTKAAELADNRSSHGSSHGSKHSWKLFVPVMGSFVELSPGRVDFPEQPRWWEGLA